MINNGPIDVVYRTLIPVADTSIIEESPGAALEIVSGWTPTCHVYARTFNGDERELQGDLRDGGVVIANFHSLRFEFRGVGAQLFKDRLSIAIYSTRRTAIVGSDSTGPGGAIKDLSRLLIQNVAAGGAFTLWDDAVNSTSGTAPEDVHRIFSPNGWRDRRELWLGGFVHAQGQAAALTQVGQLWLLAYNNITNPTSMDQPYPIAVLAIKTAVLPATVKASAAPGAVEHWWRPESSEGVNQQNYGVRWPPGGGKLVYYNADLVNAAIIRSQICLLTY